MSDHQYALGVVGTGHIAMVIVRRLIESGYLSGERIIVTDSAKLRSHPLPVRVATDIGSAVSDSRIVMISVTPQRFAEAADAIRQRARGDHIFLSVMAGVSTQRIASALGADRMRVIRSMPNLPFGLGRGVTGLFRGEHASMDDLEEIRHLFGAGGVSVVIEDESLMDAVTAVAGSGPAYFYYFVEMLMQGGMAAGLKKEDAQILAAHACVGAGAMLLDKDASPRDLREAVTSPGGTTQAAMNRLNESDMPQHVISAVLAAFRRGQELGRLNEGR
ncbi:MAG: pyrroline-5-carboxylate reductase [Phycisphaerae bacterium]|nr:pyrroline-5-carboxylate reductase [Phycisphaerae bacterium]